MYIPARLRWHKRALTALDGDVRTAAEDLADLVDKRFSSPAGIDGKAWGQFLHDSSRTDAHWGRYGTSAAVQVLLVKHVLTRANGKVADCDPLTTVTVLPRDGTLLTDAYKRRDLTRPLKLAAWSEAIDPDSDGIEEVPEVVERLLELRVDENGWSTRPKGDRARSTRDRRLPTAYILYALRRYPSALKDPRIAKAHGWLARQMSDGTLAAISIDVAALSALALRYAPEPSDDRPDDAEIESARRRLEAALRDAVLDMSDPRIDRPHFHALNEGDGRHDYLFLSPELLITLHALEGSNPKATRAFVLRIVRAVVDNICDREAAGRFGDMRGFRIQRSEMMGTVDQMWAARVLLAYHRRFQDDRRSLKPPWVPRLRIKRSLRKVIFLALGVVLVATGAVVLAHGHQQQGFALMVTGSLVSTFGRMLFSLALKARGSRK